MQKKGKQQKQPVGYKINKERITSNARLIEIEDLMTAKGIINTCRAGDT
jgi:hypothetical protein